MIVMQIMMMMLVVGRISRGEKMTRKGVMLYVRKRLVLERVAMMLHVLETAELFAVSFRRLAQVANHAAITDAPRLIQ